MLLRQPPGGEGGASGSGALLSPAAIVLIVIVLGAMIYLRQARYIRRKTANIVIGVLLVVLILVGYSTYIQS